ncbi:RagB/SusD family nutrient uptake outer membrane protein [Xanthocytophaga agilis]|uniref:RagB/SusD family nutrient uptake outer membrane protein n=1 Tax=Xanthocytophaga agilis TaxID=3048010 RepID=A0AAE3R4V1_9BACT|nr:RagB/SusD family nutrient uptake outer membrane protein [Xanthocytophaga agilis]MDJ1503819.1 RagB/SusD family nutrient uptake outer membrane protein [Xanthocytophaga agilis]
MKKAKFIVTLVIAASIPLFYSCGDNFLDKPAQGALNNVQLGTRAGVDALLTGAYAALDGSRQDNQNFSGSNSWEAAPDNWVYGSVAGGDAHKGSNGADQPAIDGIAKFITDPSNGYLNSKWRTVYEGVSRANSVLVFLKVATDVTPDEAKSFEAQARFLRAHYYFELKKMFNNVPWIDENTIDYTKPTPESFNVPNTEDIWPKIEADFLYAYQNLPETQSQVGRVNKWAAGAYLAKAYLYQKKYTEAKPVFDDVITNGVTSNGLKYGLTDNYEDNFNPAVENNKESVFAIQQVANDGTNTIGNANNGGMLNFPYNSPFRCCGFYQPSQDLVNSFRTNATGLPFLDNYNGNAVKSDMGIKSDQAFTPDEGSLDPRLDWTVGRRGIPYLDWGLHPGANWVRDQSYGGPYAPKKNVYWQATQDKYADQHTWAPGTAINILVIRFADVLLMAAEVEAQLGNLDKAQTYVNQVRARAANPASFVYQYKSNSAPMTGFSTTPAANYNVSQYPAGNFATNGQAYALKAIYFERKLELAMEGHRFFDLVRWGIAETTLNAYLTYESTVTSDLTGGKFTAPQDEYYPIPQRQIDLQTVNGTSTLTQNEGYR